MAGIFGVLGLSDTERVFANTVGQAVVYDGIARLVARYNQEMRAATGAFVEEETANFQERYKLPGGGRLQRRGGQASSAAVKAHGGYDVAYPLEDYGAQLADSDVALAYMTLQDLDRHLDTILAQDANTLRFELLKALFNNTARTFVDPLHGALTVQPLANGDAVLYPPTLGSETEATENHYIETGYAATAISDTNNPYITVRDELEEHFGAAQGGGNLAVFIHPNETPETEALTDFDPLNDRFVTPGDDTATLHNLPHRMPGRLIGRVSGCWVYEWRWIPAGYMAGVDLDAPRPLKIRVDPTGTGLGRGLQLVAADQDYPLESAHYRHRFGIGCGNRLNGVVLELAAGAGYTVPAIYA